MKKIKRWILKILKKEHPMKNWFCGWCSTFFYWDEYDKHRKVCPKDEE